MSRTAANDSHTTGTPLLTVTGLRKVYGEGQDATVALADVTFAVGAGEIACIVGPSGSGKTTLLKCVTGLLPISGGEVTLAGAVVDAPVPQMAVVFQDYSRSLLPWMTIRQNAELPLRNKPLSRNDRRRRVEESLTAVGLGKFMDFYPWQLSGGMQQRAAIARALAFDSEILIMDEPFASLDAQTRSDLEDLVLRLNRDSSLTILFVTHDIDESVYLGDRVVVLGNAPTEVKREYLVGLPRDRNQLTTKSDAEFIRIRNAVLTDISNP